MFVLTWQISWLVKPNDGENEISEMSCSSIHELHYNGTDSTVSFADVDHLQQFIQPATLTSRALICFHFITVTLQGSILFSVAPRQLLIKVESKQKSVLLETRDESLHKRFY